VEFAITVTLQITFAMIQVGLVLDFYVLLWVCFVLVKVKR